MGFVLGRRVLLRQSNSEKCLPFCLKGPRQRLFMKVHDRPAIAINYPIVFRATQVIMSNDLMCSKWVGRQYRRWNCLWCQAEDEGQNEWRMKYAIDEHGRASFYKVYVCSYSRFVRWKACSYWTNQSHLCDQVT